MILHNKRIIVYGTGINSKHFIDENKNVSAIVCVIDNTILSGFFNGIPIYTWEEIEPDAADCLVIAANPKHTKEIYYRLIYDCDRNGLAIYDWRGIDLRKAYRYEYILPETYNLYSKNRRENLLKAIDNHEAISFDLFDTLLMRRVIAPEDVYDIVDRKLPNTSILKGQFKKIRRECELESNSVIKGFEKIYDQLIIKANISKEEAEYIARIELATEKELLVCREGMREIFEYAVKTGKRVNIISDMYFGKEELEKILEFHGIRGYEKIYVSCDFGKSKRKGLFDVYKHEVKAGSYLHIGDNDETDGISAEKHGIDSFLIPSGIMLLRASNIRRLLYYAKGVTNRLFIGELIADVFNDPFCLCGRNGVVPVNTSRILGKYFVAPIIFTYVKELLYIQKEKNYDKVLLGSRDCYLFSKIVKNLFPSEYNLKYVYIYISRELAFKLGMGNEIVDKDYEKYLVIDDRRRIEEDPEFLSGREVIPYRKTKESYERYLKKLGIDKSGRYLFCDLISGGTVQHSLVPAFEKELEGFYLNRTFSYMDRKLNYISVFEREDYPHDQLMVDRLETLICSPEPSVKNIDEKGDFIFGHETRSKSELTLLNEIQKEIIDSVCDFINHKYDIEKYMSIDCLIMLDNLNLYGELEQMKDWIYFDSNGEQVRLFK
ncbi:hypothetical protein [Oribacterium sp. NK2B42]|uniref:hypothetical protein n=1 Tax=Oribacterium sp. NK2B42 TaxID=689781 RepID=UPI000416F412|nr:hypothetical protein [Oribacterium sp. NK2B42]